MSATTVNDGSIVQSTNNQQLSHESPCDTMEGQAQSVLQHVSSVTDTVQNAEKSQLSVQSQSVADGVCVESDKSVADGTKTKGANVPVKRVRTGDEVGPGEDLSDMRCPIYFENGMFNFSNADAIQATAGCMFKKIRTCKFDAEPIFDFPELGPKGGPTRLRVCQVRWAIEERQVFGGPSERYPNSKPRVSYKLLCMGNTSVGSGVKGSLVDGLWVPPVSNARNTKECPVTK